MDQKNNVSAEQMSPAALAFVGDAVYSLIVRSRLAQGRDLPVGRLHNEAAELVSAQSQAAAVERILPALTEKESDIFRRGRNAHTARTPKSASVGEYHAATGLECLLGYLYLKGEMERIEEFIHIIFNA